ncbi:hypothetical protein BV20DRAFT_1092854 [Pilatotrama ljubarskyi]|nr:hypothetical protein BV20DRAFT_1092854 [Pilatotrama ljubarskyi]
MMPLPISILTKELLAFAKDRPLQVWAIGCELGREDIARAGAQAAAHLKELGTYSQLGEFVPVKEFLLHTLGVSAGDYFRLMQVHRLGRAVPSSFTLTRPVARNQDAPGSCASSPTYSMDGFFSSLSFTDIICRASDGHEFPLHRGLLCLCSPILSKRLASAAQLESTKQSSPSERKASDTPSIIVDFVEDSTVLAALLRHCYPGDHPLPDSIPLLLAIFGAAESYGMTHIANHIRSQWGSIAARAPLSAYFAAAAAGLQHEARVAARQALQVTVIDEYVPEMEGSSAQVYQRLLDYHQRARELATRIANQKVWRANRIHDAATVTSNPGASPGQKKKRNHRSNPVFHTTEAPCGGGCQGFRGRTWLQERRTTYLQHLAERPGKPFVSETALLASSAALSLGEKTWAYQLRSPRSSISSLFDGRSD